MSIPLVTGERAIVVTRQHWSVVAPHVVVPALVAIAGLVAAVRIPATVSGHSIATIRQGLAAAIVVVAGLVILVRVLRWRSLRYALTDRRILVMRGVLSRYAESIALDRVQNTIVHQSLFARLIGCGDIEIESAGRDGTEMLHRIPRAQAFEGHLMEAIENHRRGTDRPPGAGV